MLIDPLGHEPEFHPGERRFECDLDLSVLDIQLDRCSPNARSRSDTRRSVRSWMAMPGACNWRDSARYAPRFTSSVMRRDDTSPG